MDRFIFVLIHMDNAMEATEAYFPLIIQFTSQGVRLPFKEWWALSIYKCLSIN